ncbi:MAG: hypothetical protein ACLGHN_05475 [Bacteriovoracia bacterium]
MEIKNIRLLKVLKINAIVLYPFVLYCDKHPSKEIIVHEHVHLSQMRKDGVIRFYCRYLKEYFQGRLNGLSHYQAYRSISYEREAFDSARAT